MQIDGTTASRLLYEQGFAPNCAATVTIAAVATALT